MTREGSKEKKQPSKRKNVKGGRLPVDPTIPRPVRERAKTVENHRRYKWNKFITAAVTIIAVGTLAYYGGGKETVSGWINQINDAAGMATEMTDEAIEELAYAMTPEGTESPFLEPSSTPTPLETPDITTLEPPLPSAEPKVESAYINPILEDDTKAVKIGPNEVLVHPVGLGPRTIKVVTDKYPGFLTYIVKSKDLDHPEEGGLLSCSDPKYYTKGYDDARILLLGKDLEDGSYEYNIPLDDAKGVTTINCFNSHRDQYLYDPLKLQMIDANTGKSYTNDIAGGPDGTPQNTYVAFHLLKKPGISPPTGKIDPEQALKQMAAAQRKSFQRKHKTGIF